MKFKGTLYFLLFFLFCKNAVATDNLGYFVYFVKDYIQGNWVEAEKVQAKEGRFLLPHYFQENLGYSDSNVYIKIFEKLKSDKPEIYKNSTLDKNLSLQESYENITIYLNLDDSKKFETIKNEILASFLSYGTCRKIFFKNDPNTSVKINFKTTGYDNNDIDIPKFEMNHSAASDRV